MAIRDELKKTLIQAMKGRDTARVEAIRYLNAVLTKKEKDSRQELDEKAVIGVISSLCKQRKDSIEQFKKGGRDDLVNKEEAELAFLQSLLPAQMSKDEVLSVVLKAIQTVGAKGPKEMGLVMKQVMQEISGKAEGQLISATVKVELNKLA